MPKKDRRSKIHDAETIDLMVTNESLKFPDRDITAEDMSEAWIESEEDAFDKTRKQSEWKKELKKRHDP